MKLLKYLFTIALFWFSIIVSVAAQSNVSLYGSVKGSDYTSSDIVPNDWPVSITAVRLDNNSQTKKTSKGGSFHVAAPRNTLIDLVFCSTGYGDYTVGRINTAGLSEYRVPPVPVSLNKIVKESALVGRPRTKLGQARTTAQRTGEIDIFLYNLEVYRSVYAGDRAAMEEIDQFELDLRGDQSFKSQLTPERVKRWEVYKQTLNKSAEKPAVDPSEIMGLVKDESVFPGIRIDMIRKHLDLIDRSTVKTEVLTYFRKEGSEPASALFAASLVALGKIGNNTTDRQILLENLMSNDSDRQIAS
ncbi:MAG: hypothetical protein QOG23_3214 [Blastocatellia bacterium]|jgi:hypothetical protein|nr:hypothetical protein [Blastocatellia bacterium]